VACVLAKEKTVDASTPSLRKLASTASGSPTSYKVTLSYSDTKCTTLTSAETSYGGVCYGGDVVGGSGGLSTAYSTSGTTLTTTTSIFSSTTCAGSATSTTPTTESTACTVVGTGSTAVSSSTSAPTTYYGLTSNVYVDSACATQSMGTSVTIGTLNTCTVHGTTSFKVTQSGSTITLTNYSDTSCTTSTGTPLTITTGTCTAVSGATSQYQKYTYTEAPASPSTATCFASSETVQLQDGSVKALRDVQIGDRVLTAAMDGSVKGYSPVIAVPHAGDVSTTASFVQLVTAEKDVKMTADHLVLAGSCDAATPLSLVQAGSVTAGQCLQTTSGKAAVTATRRNVPGQGLASVVTKAGGLVVVNGIAASPFAINHAIPEAWYSIHRLVFSVFPAALGFKLFQQTSERFGDLSLDFSL